MNKIQLRGCGTALITPFKNNEIDYAAYEKSVKRQLEAGVDFLVPLGTTAETPTLEEDERFQILEKTKELSGNTPVIVGCGTNSLKGTLKNMGQYEKYNPDGYLVVVPYYNKPTQEGIYRYFKALSESTDKSLVLYNVPSRTGTNMTGETTLRLAELENVVAVKEASGNISQIMEIMRNRPDNFSVLSGNDDQTLPLMTCGADGVISVVSNLVPDKMVKLVHCVLSGKFGEAIELNKKLMPLHDACFVESNPIPVKAGMEILKICGSEVRLPLTEATETTKKLMQNILENYE